MSTTTAPLIDAEQVSALFLSLLFTEAELPPKEYVTAEGITFKVGFHPGRLQAAQAQIITWLDALPRQFWNVERGGGGGWSFLSACNDRNDVQWTGFHERMDQLFAMGQAIGYVQAQIPRALWSAMPGGMPYYVVGGTPAITITQREQT